MTDHQHFHQQLSSLLKREPAVVATIVKVIGSAPREVGAKMAICTGGRIIGTIGGGAGEGKVIQQALSVFAGEKQLVEIDLTGTPGQETQGVCGGKVQIWLEAWSGKGAIALVEQILKSVETGKSSQLVTPLVSDRQPYLVNAGEQLGLTTDCFVETLQPLSVLLIMGGGHVAVALAQIASFAGFQIAVQDDRPDFVTPQRFPQAMFLSSSISETLNRFTAHSQLYVALVTRGYSQDIEALQALLRCSLAYQYVGMIGSQKRVCMVRQALQQQGIFLEKLTSFYAPIGLDIGALTPQEIAVSICGELIKVRRGGTGRSLCQRVQQSQASSKVHSPVQEETLLYAKP